MTVSLKRLLRSYLFLFFGLSLVLPFPVNANDSIARVEAGGISLLKSEHIRMAQEILEISPTFVRVRYKFFNESDKPIRTTIAFPMPPYHARHPDDNAARNNRPLRPFATLIEGKNIPSKLERRAKGSGQDVTDKIRSIGLDDTALFFTFANCSFGGDFEPMEVCGITAEQMARLREIGLYGWSVEETAVWEYEFPSRKFVDVLHEYEPFTGERYYYVYDYFDQFRPQSDTEEIKTVSSSSDCAGNEWKAIDKRVKAEIEKGAIQVAVSVIDVGYILHTGANWKGPIEDFKLRVIKDDPSQVISLCFPGNAKKIDALTFEFSHHDFLPKDDLRIEFHKVAGIYNPSNAALDSWGASGYAKLGDVESLPTQNPYAKKWYKEFLAKLSPRAFLICTDNDSVRIISGKADEVSTAIQSRESGCEPYAVNGEVVWRGK